MVCARCTEEFLPGQLGEAQRYCSRGCANARVGDELRRCAECTRSFPARVGGKPQRYCSSRCRTLGRRAAARKRQAARRATDNAAVLAANRKSYAKNGPAPYDPLKDGARHAVRRALRTGELVRQPCEVCGVEQTHAHHSDYSRPLDVRWLCSTHHGLEHRRINAAAIAVPADSRCSVTGGSAVASPQAVQ